MVVLKLDLQIKIIKKLEQKFIHNAKDIFKDAEIIVKVKEPQMNEVEMIREGQIIYTYLHLAAAKELTEGLNKIKINLYSLRNCY